MNCLWTSELSGEVVGVIGLAHTSPHSVKIDEFRIRPEWQHTSIPKRLLEQVRQYCSDSGRMKLQVETGTVPGWLVTQIGRSGFRMAREAAVNGITMHEFYLDLYHESQSDSGTRQPVLRVLLADDHSVLRKGICEMLHERPGIEVVGEAQDGQEAVQMALAIQTSC
jgi:CheY-like chemotaxis protein